MPSPAAHVLGGLATAFIVDTAARRPCLTMPILIGSAALAVAPDLDLLTTSHRTYSHSVGAVAIVGVVSWLVLRVRSRRGAGAAALTAAYASHLLLDWLSKDTRSPSGITALWPFTARYYQSPWSVFGEISRRYWLPHEFIVRNLEEAAWECAVMAPLLLVAWAVWGKRTLTR
jgi:membrane-bound metal-dependent hydrolase YbcI (DUF457 family)